MVRDWESGCARRLLINRHFMMTSLTSLRISVEPDKSFTLDAEISLFEMSANCGDECCSFILGLCDQCCNHRITRSVNAITCYPKSFILLFPYLEFFSNSC